MKKFVFLTPCLMQDNNREANKQALNFWLEMFPDIKHFIYEQEYKEDDFTKHPNVEYIAGNPERQGFLKPREELLKKFYDSDYDYAIWVDATDRITKPGLNDFATFLDYLSKDDSVLIPLTRFTQGNSVVPLRTNDHQRPDYFENAVLYKDGRSSSKSWWSTGTLLSPAVMLNFKKHYNVDLKFPKCSDDDIRNKGIGEDCTLLVAIESTFGVFMVLPCVTPSAIGGSRTSTWVAREDGRYTDYIHMDHSVWYGTIVDKAQESVVEGHKVELPNRIVMPRVEQFKELLKPFKPRSKKSKPHVYQEGDLF